jgi:hypothetical protein
MYLYICVLKYAFYDVQVFNFPDSVIEINVLSFLIPLFLIFFLLSFLNIDVLSIIMVMFHRSKTSWNIATVPEAKVVKKYFSFYRL